MMYKYFRKIDTAYAKFPSMGLIKSNKNYSYEKSDDTIHWAWNVIIIILRNIFPH